jgi:hypothetical protein
MHLVHRLTLTVESLAMFGEMHSSEFRHSNEGKINAIGTDLSILFIEIRKLCTVKNVKARVILWEKL